MYVLFCFLTQKLGPFYRAFLNDLRGGIPVELVFNGLAGDPKVSNSAFPVKLHPCRVMMLLPIQDLSG